ncbi:lipid-A-disaccharide synthase [Fusobacterium sp.]|uniref:lipid-A-disaccharide synthase n=1 Tax=Fusobacterium sp. TaxID=68766 RepID=UPI0026173A32|nr:lipid-A-disaccharide synthase [Fusobacterium sp.]
MKIFVSTGEVSGDLHLSYLVKNMLKIDNSVEFYGVAGDHSREVGVNVIQDIKDLAVMGFVEGLKKYSFLKKKAVEYLEFIKKNQIEKVILVDYGGFNLAFLKLLKKEVPNVEVYFYIPPKLWVWGEKRIKTLKLADHILVIFPWEVDFYKKHGVDAVYYGNPFSEKYSLIEERGDKILLLPGSRKQEIKSLLPVMLEVVKSKPEKTFILKLHSEKSFEWIEEDLLKYPNLLIETNKKLEEAVKESEVAIAASGTVTLELSLMGIPTIVLYKTSAINAFIARHILKLGLVSLPNLTLNKEVYPELLQERCTSKEIIFYLNLIKSKEDKINREIKEIREKLSGKDVVKNYGEYILRG